MVLDPIKLKSMLPIDGSMEKGFIGELMTPTEASTSACPNLLGGRARTLGYDMRLREEKAVTPYF